MTKTFAPRKPEQLVRVMIACNDYRNGVFGGELSGLQLEDDEDHFLNLAGVDIPFEWFGDVLAFGIEAEAFMVRGRSYWVGNWCWDATRMRLSEALRLAEFVMAHGLSAEEWTEEGPFAELAETGMLAACDAADNAEGEPW